MTIRSQGRKKSNFPADTGIPSGATFDFVSSGTNWKITAENLIPALGLTGKLLQDGAVTGVPVLDKQGVHMFIRNLEVAANSGLSAAVSAENGITLALNAQVTNGTGVPVLDSTNKIRNIKAGDGIAVSLSTDDIVVTVSGLPSPTLTTGITAYATGGQANATLLTTVYNQVSTCVTAGDSVLLPPAAASLERTVINNGAEPLDLFPSTGDKIDAGAANTAIRVQPNGTVKLYCYDTTNWVTV